MRTLDAYLSNPSKKKELIKFIELQSQRIITRDQACKALGIHRDTFLRLKSEYKEGLLN